MIKVKEKIVADSLYYTATIEYKNTIFNCSAAWFIGESCNHLDWFITSDNPEEIEKIDPDDKTELKILASEMFEDSLIRNVWDHFQTEKQY